MSLMQWFSENLEGLGSVFVFLAWIVPMIMGGGLAGLKLLGVNWSERQITWAVMLGSLSQGLGVLGLTGIFLAHGPLTLRSGHWFALPGYRFPIVYVIDGISLPLLILTGIIGFLIIRYSRTYLHRDEGYLRFFVLTSCTLGGMALVLLSGTLDMLIAGWEFVGLSSALLIAFFQRRKAPVQNALRAFAHYRICDIGLIAAAVITHHGVSSAEMNHLTELNGSEAAWVGFALLIAAAGKSALWPVSGWFPRAMEGPTPSSALFYGGLSVHAGVYLLLRAAPLLSQLPALRFSVILIGILTALHGWLTHRVQADAKNRLALATMTQVGVITAMIGMGWVFLPVALICGHAGIRIYQFLRVPNLLHDDHVLHSAVGGNHYSDSPPSRVSSFGRAIYNYGFALGYLDELVDRYLIAPFSRLAKALDYLETKTTENRGASAGASRILGIWIGIPAALFVSSQWIGVPALAYLGVPLIFVCAAVFPFHSWVPALFERWRPGLAAIFFAPFTQGFSVIVWFKVFGSTATPQMYLAISLFAVFTSVYAAVMACVQRNARRWVGWLCVSLSAQATCAWAGGGGTGQISAILLSVALSLCGLALALSVEALEERVGDSSFDNHRGLGIHAPLLSTLFLVFGLVVAGLPGLMSFVGEDLLFASAYSRLGLASVLLIVAGALNAIAVFRARGLLFLGVVPKIRVDDLLFREKAALGALFICLLGCGLFPKFWIDTLVSYSNSNSKTVSSLISTSQLKRSPHE